MLNTVNQKAAHLFMHLLMRTLGHIFVYRGLRASATTFVLLMSVVVVEPVCFARSLFKARL